MSEPRQFRVDPATGGFCEDRLSESPLPLKVCPNPACDGNGYYIGPRCGACGWSADPDAVIVTDDDDEDVDEPTTDEPTQPELPPAGDPPGGSD